MDLALNQMHQLHQLHQEDHRWISRIATDLDSSDMARMGTDGAETDNQVKSELMGNLSGNREGGEACTKKNVYLPHEYFQCRAAREATFSDKAVEISAQISLGCIVGGEPFRIGAFDQQMGGLGTCFVGSRVSKGDNLANQNISSSFDPATLVCITCETHHPLLGSNPICICVSDQNFVPNMSGGRNCVGIIRLENCSLREQTEMVQEVFSGCKFPAGSVILMGSASHLHRVGATLYALDWNTAILQLGKSLANVQLCPLIPLLGENIPGSLGRDMVRITAWLEKMYEGSILGLKEVWALCAGFVARAVDNGLLCKTYDTVAMPGYLGPNPPLVPYRFVSTSSCHIDCLGFSVKAIEELARALLIAIQKNFGIATYPEDPLVRDPEAEEGGKGPITNVILIGASNMGRVINHLESAGLKVLNCPIVGSIPAEKTLEGLRQKMSELTPDGGTALIFDLFGITCYRFEQPDGTMAVPIMLGGRYHLLGNVGVITDENLKIVIRKVLPILDHFTSLPKVVIPPIPRYVGGGCCHDVTHAPNVTNKGYGEGMVEKTAHMRKVLREELKNSSLKQFWVPDIISGLIPANVKSLADTAAELALLSVGDNVHYTSNGYKLLSETICHALVHLQNKAISAVPPIAGPRSTLFYWRGFVSCRGSARAARTSYTSGRTSSAPSRGGSLSRRDSGGSRGGSSYHPYSRGGGRRH